MFSRSLIHQLRQWSERYPHKPLALTGNVTAIETADWASGTYVWKVFTSNGGPSTPSTGSGTTGTLAETGKWIKE